MRFYISGYFPSNFKAFKLKLEIRKIEKPNLCSVVRFAEGSTEDTPWQQKKQSKQEKKVRK